MRSDGEVSMAGYGFDSPVGPLCVAVDEIGSVTGVRFSQAPSGPLKLVHPVLAAALDRYFSAGEDLAGVTVRLSVSKFQKAVLAVLRSIPVGDVRTYAQVASTIGIPGASRAVGRACATNPVPIIIPCHRVLASLSLGGYQNGLESKALLLEHEGAGVFSSDGRGAAELRLGSATLRPKTAPRPEPVRRQFRLTGWEPRVRT